MNAYRNFSLNVLLGFFALAITVQPAVAITAEDRKAALYRSEFYDPDDEFGCTQGAGNLPGTVPAPYKDIFIKAGAKHNVEPALIAGIFFAGEHASSWPEPPPPYGNGRPWASSPVGASGPFQFMPPTWAAYGDDGDGDGDKDIQDLTDAAFGAAKYLAANGGTIGSPDGTPKQQPKEGPSIRNAIWHYNHADWYVERVFKAYQEFLAGGSPSTNAGCGGGLGIGADGFVFPLKATKSIIRWCHQSTTSCHGTKGKDFYNAADIHAPTGTPIVASKPGTITKIGSNPLGYTIKGDDGLWYYYTHLLDGSTPTGLTVGTHVEAGQVLGQVGNTADAEGADPHLHFHVGPTAESLNVSRECVESGACRQTAAQLIDPQPVLVSSFTNLPE